MAACPRMVCLLPSGNLTVCYGKIHPFFMGKLTISMAIFNSYVTNYQRVSVFYDVFGICEMRRNHGLMYFISQMLVFLAYVK